MKELGKSMDSFNFVSLRSHGDIPPNVASLVEALGKLLFNCGMLEFYSRNLIWELELNISKRNKLHNKLWSNRTEKLEKLINKKLRVEDLKSKWIQALKNTGEIMNFRNSLAHASLIESNKGEIGIVDSFLKDPDNEEDPNMRGKIPLEEICEKINETADLVDQWGQLWKDYELKNPSKD